MLGFRANIEAMLCCGRAIRMMEEMLNIQVIKDGAMGGGGGRSTTAHALLHVTLSSS